MNGDQGAGLIAAARKGDFEFTAEVLGVGMPKQVVGDCFSVGRDVECFGMADASQRAGGDVSNRVAAGFAGGDAHRGQATEHVRDVFNVNVMELNILPGGNVADAVGDFLGQIRQFAKLSGIERAEWNFNALHSRCIPGGFGTLCQRVGGKVEFLGLDAVVPAAVVVALAVGSASQAGFGEDALLDFALFAKVHLGFELIDLAGHFRRNLAVQFFFPSHRTHGYDLQTLEYSPPRGGHRGLNQESHGKKRAVV